MKALPRNSFLKFVSLFNHSPSSPRGPSLQLSCRGLANTPLISQVNGAVAVSGYTFSPCKIPFRPLSSHSLGYCKNVFLHHKTMVIAQIYYIYGLNPFKVAGSATGHTDNQSDNRCLHMHLCAYTGMLTPCDP